MKDGRWILDKIEKNATLDTFFPSGFSSVELPEWCTVKVLTRLGTALLEPGRSMLGLELRSPSILSLSRKQKSVLAVVVLSFSRVAAPECFKPWHSLLIEMLPDIPPDALDFISRLLACDIQFRLDFFSKSTASVVVRSLATSFAIQVLPSIKTFLVVSIIQTFLQCPDKFVTTIKDMLPSQCYPTFPLCLIFALCLYSVAASVCAYHMFYFLCCRYLTALKLLCSLLQRPGGSLVQVPVSLFILI